MKNLKLHLAAILKSGLGFGVGFLSGGLVMKLLFQSSIMGQIQDIFEAEKFVAALILIVLVVTFGGSIGGLLGGFALSYAWRSEKKITFILQSGLSFGLSYSLILYPLILIISIYSLNNAAESSPIDFMVVIALVAAIFGAVSSLLLGLLTVGRQAWRVVIVGTLGFALAGAGLGYGLWFFLFGPEGLVGVIWRLSLWTFVFGTVGGGSLGLLYSWMAHRRPSPSLFSRLVSTFKNQSALRRISLIILLIVVALGLRGFWLFSPFNSVETDLTRVFESNTLGVHWSTPTSLINTILGAEASVSNPDLHVIKSGGLVITWSQHSANGSDIYFASQIRDKDNSAYHWTTPVKVSQNEKTESDNAKVVVDQSGRAHIVFIEYVAADSEHAEILYSQCYLLECTIPFRLSNRDRLNCNGPSSAANNWPTIAINEANTVMATWNSGQSTFPYSTWSSIESPPEFPIGCIPVDKDGKNQVSIQQPILSVDSDGTFNLVFDQTSRNNGSEVHLSRFDGENWTIPTRIGRGNNPVILTDSTNRIHLAWCGSSHTLNYWNSSQQIVSDFVSACEQRPTMFQDSDGTLHLVWHANHAENNYGLLRPASVIHEIVSQSSGWSPPIIIARTNGPVRLSSGVTSDGSRHLVWADNFGESSNINYATQTDYDCAEALLTPIGQVVLNIVRQENYRSPLTSTPFCRNRYDGLLFTPNPEPEFSNDVPTQNGAFDDMADLIKTAQYEIAFATMWYNEAVDQDSPGSVLAEAIAELYRELEENPSLFPKGLTIRILLGNPPEFGLFPTLNSQIWTVLSDLTAAGIPEMRNSELGWKLEVANFGGSWPHSHTKILVVDGKSAIAMGYNMQYTHFSEDHPSGLGGGRVDLGLQITGPIAQETLQVFDDLWLSSTNVYCSDFGPDASILSIFSCRVLPINADHVPEVLRYFLPSANSNAFSLYRTQNFREADEAISKALASANSSIDVLQVSFSLELVCDLGILIEVCNYSNRLGFLDGIMTAVEINGAKVRIIVKEGPFDGIENKIAIKIFQNELAVRGLTEYVEIRFFSGETHVKAVSIDESFLIVGSHNFHHSAWGDNALTEYSLAIEDSQALLDYQRMFNYYWSLATSISE